jgi:hypothetical protein
LPEYVTYFVNNGFTLEQLKRFFLQYNEGVKRKITNPMDGNLSDESYNKMRECLFSPVENNDSSKHSKVI